MSIRPPTAQYNVAHGQTQANQPLQRKKGAGRAQKEQKTKEGAQKTRQERDNGSPWDLQFSLQAAKVGVWQTSSGVEFHSEGQNNSHPQPSRGRIRRS